MKKMMLVVVVSCFVCPIVAANKSLNWDNFKKLPREKEIYLFATGYYHPKEDQEFYATGSYEEDVELNGQGITASGKRVRRGHVAVDPAVIPLGSKLYSEKYGVLSAEDTGGRIKGNRIDIFTGEGEKGLSEALKIRGWLRVKILATKD